VHTVTISVTPSSTAETPGYLGSTSFSEVFKASRHQSDDVWLGPLANVKKSLRTPANNHYRLQADRINSGAAILDLFVDFPFINRTVEEYYVFSQIVIAPLITIKNSLGSIQKTLLEYSTKSQRQRLAEEIFAQTFTPLVIDENCDAETLHLSFTGTKLRWEILGLLFTTLALGTLLDHNELQTARLDRQNYTRELTHASNLCVSFCDRSESLNDLLIWLLHNNSILLTFQYGDASIDHRPLLQLYLLLTCYRPSRLATNG
jgi:hypothetical protein